MKNSAAVKRMKKTVLALALADQNPYVSRYRADVVFKAKISLLWGVRLFSGAATQI